MTENKILPRLDKMFLIGIWVETVLYGMNTLIYSAAIIILSRKLRGVNQTSARVLIPISSVAFLLSTAYVAVSLRQLMEAFVYGPPGKATLYFADEGKPLPQSKLGLYTANVCLQDLVLIWRLWVVFGRNNLIVIPPLILEVGRTGSSIVAMTIGGRPGVSIFNPLVHDMGIVDWTFDLALNIGVTALISFRLWRMGHEISALTPSLPGGSRKNRYMSVILTFVESGSLFAIATLVTVSLYLSGNVATVVAIDSIAQLATITPLLIVVRVAFGLTHGSGSSDTVECGHDSSTASSGPITFAKHVRIQVTRKNATDSNAYELSSASKFPQKK